MKPDAAAQAGAARPIDPRILDEAAGWLMRLHAGTMSDTDLAACERWRQRSPAHASAWARAETLMRKLGGLPPALALPALDRPASPGRRAATARLAMLLATVPAGWAAWRLAPWQAWTAEHHTAAGEQREIRLADGTRIVLNTDSAIDVRYDAAQRLVLLRAGEILVRTAPDNGPVHRPFLVDLPEGRLEALGTHFNVRQQDNRAEVAVLEGAVRIRPARAGAERILQAGEQAGFTDAAIGAVAPADDAIGAWTRGMLVADRMPLATFAAELSRYRSGMVRCDPAVARLPVSGAFPVTDTERALAMLAATYPVDAVMRTRYWVTLVARVSSR